MKEDPFSNLNESLTDKTLLTKIDLIKNWEGYNRICDEGVGEEVDNTSIEEFKFLPFIFLQDTTKYQAFTVYKGRVWTLKDKTLQKRDISHFYELENERNFLLERYADVPWRWAVPQEQPEIFGDLSDYPTFIRSLMQVLPFTNHFGTTWTEPAKDPFVRVLENEEGMDEPLIFNPYPTPTPYYLAGLFNFFIRRVILPNRLEISKLHYPRFPKSNKELTFFNFLCFLPQSLVLLNKYINATVLSHFSFRGFSMGEVDIDSFFFWIKEMKKDQERYGEWFTHFNNFYNSLRADKSITSFFSIEPLLNEASLLQIGFESILKERKYTFNSQEIKLETYRKEKKAKGKR